MNATPGENSMTRQRSSTARIPKPGRRLVRPDRFAADELVLQPWFLPKRVQLTIARVIPPNYRNKMRAYFDDYGCMICTRDDYYEANGMCRPCFQTVQRNLLASVRRRMKAKPGDRFDSLLLRKARIAKKLLGEFPKPKKSVSGRCRVETNPVEEALRWLPCEEFLSSAL